MVQPDALLKERRMDVNTIPKDDVDLDCIGQSVYYSSQSECKVSLINMCGINFRNDPHGIPLVHDADGRISQLTRP